MDQKVYHGNISPLDVANCLAANFNHGNLQVRQYGNDPKITIQMVTSNVPNIGGPTALTVIIQRFEDGVVVQLGQQEILGVAASIGTTVFSAIRNPWSLLSRIDDLAQDIESIQLKDQVWRVVDELATTLGSGQELSKRLKRMVCSYCSTANPVGEAHCIGCGAPLGDVQPVTCKNCGYVIRSLENTCPNCGNPV
jgi:hypothetical protein